MERDWAIRVGGHDFSDQTASGGIETSVAALAARYRSFRDATGQLLPVTMLK
jgi:hypothetical protein